MSLQPYTQSTPVYRGLKAALDANELEFDLRKWRNYATAPITLIRHNAQALRFEPHTELFGEDLERRLLTNIWSYFRWRNYQQCLDVYAADLVFVYVYWFDIDVNTGERTHLTICITPPVGFEHDSNVLSEITRTVRWLFPHFDNNNALTVQLCPQANLDIELKLTGHIRVRQTAVLTEV